MVICTIIASLKYLNSHSDKLEKVPQKMLNSYFKNEFFYLVKKSGEYIWQ